MKFRKNQKFQTKKYFVEYHILSLNSVKQFSQLSSFFTKVIEIQPILDNISQFFQVILTIFASNILGFYRIEQEIMRFYKSLQRLMIAMIFYNIFSVKSLTFVPFRSIAMYYWHFVISYHEIFLFAIIPFRLQATSVNILPSSNER